jgi:hypothetical protein
MTHGKSYLLLGTKTSLIPSFSGGNGLHDNLYSNLLAPFYLNKKKSAKLFPKPTSEPFWRPKPCSEHKLYIIPVFIGDRFVEKGAPFRANTIHFLEDLVD